MLLGLDLGTTNVKAVVTDFGGRQRGEGSCAAHLFQLGGFFFFVIIFILFSYCLLA